MALLLAPDRLYGTLHNLFVACKKNDDPRARQELQNLDLKTREKILQRIPASLAPLQLADLKNAIAAVTEEAFNALSPEAQATAAKLSQISALQMAKKTVKQAIAQGRVFPTVIQQTQTMYKLQAKILKDLPVEMRLKGLKALYLTEAPKMAEIAKAYEALIEMYHAAKEKNSALFQEQFYALPMEFRDRIKTLNLEFDSNDTLERLTYSTMVIEMIAKEEYHRLPSAMRSKVAYFTLLSAKALAKHYVQGKIAQGTIFKTDQDRDEVIERVAKIYTRYRETPILLGTLAFVTRNPTFEAKKR